MPKVSGLDMLQQVKQQEAYNHIPVILLTAWASEEAELQGLRAGADDYIAKPFSLPTLHVKIRNLIQLRRNLILHYQDAEPDQVGHFTANSREADFMRRILGLLDQNIDNPNLNVDFLVSEMGMSRTLLFNKLKAITGQSGKGLIMDYKMKRARQWLKRGTREIGEVSRMVGYTEPKYFSQAYKRYFGHPPSMDVP